MGIFDRLSGWLSSALSSDSIGGTVKPCDKPLKQIVTPAIDVEQDKPGEQRALRIKPGDALSDVIKVKLSASKAQDNLGYAGSGKLVIGRSSIEIFSDAACKSRVKDGTKYKFSQLLGGVTVYARAKAEGYVDLQLALASSSDKRVSVEGPTVAALATHPPNIVTPTLELEYKTVLLDSGGFAHQASTETPLKPKPTYVVASFHETTKSPPYTGGAKLDVPAKVEAFTDEACTAPLASGVITHDQLRTPGFKVWLRGKSAGTFTAKLTLDPQAETDLFVKPPVEAKMGVVLLKLAPQQFDDSKNKAAKIPRVDHVQEAMTDAGKVTPGRFILAQTTNNDATRAKLTLAKLDASQWPDGTSDYLVNLTAAGGLRVYEAERGGSALPLPIATTVSRLSASERVLWVEGGGASTSLRDGVLDLGFDRPVDGVSKTPKRHGDFARFTVVALEKPKAIDGASPLKLDGADVYINLHGSAANGRKLKVEAKLSQPLAGVKLYFRWLENDDNRKAAVSGVDVPATWRDPSRDIEFLDKAARNADTHLSATTDAQGKASVELTTSQYGGDKVKIGVYIDQDPIQGQYDPAVANFNKQKPTLSDELTVKRRFWIEPVEVEGVTSPDVGLAAAMWSRVHAKLEKTTAATYTRTEVNAFATKAIYPKYMIKVNGGNGDAVVVTDQNKANFFSKFAADADKPVKIPMVICDAQWDTGANCSAIDLTRDAADFPLLVTTDKLMIDPPLQGGDLLVSGSWSAEEPGVAGTARNGALAAAAVSISPTRANRRQVSIALPAGLVVQPTTQVRVQFVLKGAAGPYLGEYSPSTKRIIAVYAGDDVDFVDTIGHELGHAFRQVTRPGAQPAGIDPHPKQYLKQGSHCKQNTNKCLMYESGPIAGSLHQFCEICHPYVLVQDMSTLA